MASLFFQVDINDYSFLGDKITTTFSSGGYKRITLFLQVDIK